MTLKPKNFRNTLETYQMTKIPHKTWKLSKYHQNPQQLPISLEPKKWLWVQIMIKNNTLRILKKKKKKDQNDLET